MSDDQVQSGEIGTDDGVSSFGPRPLIPMVPTADGGMEPAYVASLRDPVVRLVAVALNDGNPIGDYFEDAKVTWPCHGISVIREAQTAVDALRANGHIGGST